MNIVYLNSLADKQSVEVYLHSNGITGARCVTSVDDLCMSVLNGSSAVDLYIFDFGTAGEVIESCNVLSNILSSITVFVKHVETGRRYSGVTNKVYVIPSALDIMTLFWGHPSFRVDNIGESIPALSVIDLPSMELDSAKIEVSVKNTGIEIRGIVEEVAIKEDEIKIPEVNIQKFASRTSRKSQKEIKGIPLVVRDANLSMTVPLYITQNLGKSPITIDALKRNFAVEGGKQGYSTFEEYCYGEEHITRGEYLNILQNFYNYKTLTLEDSEERTLIYDTYKPKVCLEMGLVQLEPLPEEKEEVFATSVKNLSAVNNIKLYHPRAVILYMIDEEYKKLAERIEIRDS